jgi:hypothetical protein
VGAQFWALAVGGMQTTRSAEHTSATTNLTLMAVILLSLS